MPRKTRMRGPYLGPFEASRKIASWRRFASLNAEKEGIGEPLLTQLGHLRCAIWKAMPLFFEPSALRFGAPSRAPPTPRYVWQLRHPEVANNLAPGTACGGSFSAFTQFGTSARSSAPSASFAVAPL